MDAIDTAHEHEETARETEVPAAVREPELAVHPGPREYVKVAVVLAVATALEVGLYYLQQEVPDFPQALMVALLLSFAVIKFALVVLWFMHLRFDSRIFGRLFVTGLVLALAVYGIVLLSFGVFFLS
jgi:cytochrome c oxidase subunit 4